MGAVDLGAKPSRRARDGFRLNQPRSASLCLETRFCPKRRPAIRDHAASKDTPHIVRGQPGKALEHDPEKLADFSDKIMRQIKEKESAIDSV